ncbi:hypothetical protein [Actinomadura bangladeshensis]|uniref:pPIWI-RE three-gene island domain-containing protein n=1 Tax=Actinomadura bangladeshensis TaxID=453573 RepID=A0A4R4NVI4_9ACTN|nr:hypothetical protein [Actinomadura bangladeshensis]TDC13811.1 hypothetical protein E1284_18995 [Actinomadura bangladeshensis]
MRDRTTWYRGVTAELGRHWSGLPLELQETRPSLFCQVELALRLLEKVAPGEAGEGAYTLLGGYPFARAMGFAVTEQDETALASGRHLLWTLRRHRTWVQALETYRRFPERLRAYEVPPKERPDRLSLTVANDRFTVYDAALSAPPPFAAEKFKLAPAGRSSFVERRRMASVTLPAELARPRPAGHDLSAGRRGNGAPLTVTRGDLLETARWMDAREREEEVEKPGHWESRLSEVRIALRDDGGETFTEREQFRLDGLVHMAGMVGAGKSTLMILVAVWAARLARPLRTTLVVGDVAEQLRLNALLGGIGVPAVPVLGASTRENHIQRLHRRLASQGQGSLLEHHDERFDQLSTVCVVDALRGTEAGRPLRYADAPCNSLRPEVPGAEEEAQGVLPERFRARAPEPERPRVPAEDFGKAHGCPLWGACPRHQSAREQVEALVWIANPASLVQSAVPRHLNDERLRQLELACLQSDIVFVDEADAVQMRLDQIFAPSATLVQPGPDSWLDQLHTHKIEELSRRARLPLTDVEINRWNSALGVVSTATDVLYRTLIADEELRRWADMDYFSPWTLQEKLLADWFQERTTAEETDGVPDEHELFEAYENDMVEPEPVTAVADARRRELTELFDAFRDDPLGRRGPYGSATDDMIDLTRDLLHSDSMRETRARTRTFLERLLDDTPAPVGDGDWVETTSRRLEFMLLLSALNHRLDRLTFLWPQVEAALRLDTTGNELARRPPLDYAPIIPESPMGNVLGFQYLPDERERDEDGRHSGTLRFFRCAGVGRELLLALPRLGAGTGRPGPHVVLMSGTSWAGASTRAHVTAPVNVVLKPSDRALAAVRRTTFSTRFLYDGEGHAMSLSGTPPKARPAAARALAARLGGPGRAGTSSPLAQELMLVEDDTRRRAILLVGSYKEAGTVAAELHAMERWHGRVRVLAADDADLDAAVPLAVAQHDQDGPVGVLRRGDLATFAEDPSAEVLVAPLMAVERGHNILNAQHNAAFGTALFLARPHPRPDDLSLAVFAINDWTARFVRDQARADDRAGPATFTELVGKAAGLNRAGLDFRYEARQEWRRLLSRRYVYSRLSDWEKRCFTWDQLVTTWQVIGRLVRGGVPARVVFVDAKFAPKTAAALAPGRRSGPAPARDGLLAGLRDILTPYFDPAADPAWFADPADPTLARLLYEPLYDALCNITHRT